MPEREKWTISQGSRVCDMAIAAVSFRQDTELLCATFWAHCHVAVTIEFHLGNDPNSVYAPQIVACH